MLCGIIQFHILKVVSNLFEITNIYSYRTRKVCNYHTIKNKLSLYSKSIPQADALFINTLPGRIKQMVQKYFKNFLTHHDQNHTKTNQN